MKANYSHTLKACYVGYIVQAIINNFTPLLFVTFNKQFNISIEMISILIFLNFSVQILTDISAIKIIEKIGFRNGAILSGVFGALGFILMVILPYVLPSAFLALAIAMIIAAIGSGLTEVIISPIVDSLPLGHKESAMSLLHSFYCWGCVIVITLSTLFFKFFSTANWVYLTLLWALVPIINAISFIFVPLGEITKKEGDTNIKPLFKSKVFIICLILMIFTGSIEQAMSQWASLFAEVGLNVSKEIGDILGPCMFAVFMGLARTVYGIYGKKFNLYKTLVLSTILAVITYLITVFAKNPIISLLGCSFTGLAAGIMWPGVLSLCSLNVKNAPPAMFAFLAVGGDIGCTLGPTVVGAVSSLTQKLNLPIANPIIYAADYTGLGLKCGLLIVTTAPIVMLIFLAKLKKFTKK